MSMSERCACERGGVCDEHRCEWNPNEGCWAAHERDTLIADRDDWERLSEVNAKLLNECQVQLAKVTGERDSSSKLVRDYQRATIDARTERDKKEAGWQLTCAEFVRTTKSLRAASDAMCSALGRKPELYWGQKPEMMVTDAKELVAQRDAALESEKRLREALERARAAWSHNEDRGNGHPHPGEPSGWRILAEPWCYELDSALPTPPASEAPGEEKQLPEDVSCVRPGCRHLKEDHALRTGECLMEHCRCEEFSALADSTKGET